MLLSFLVSAASICRFERAFVSPTKSELNLTPACVQSLRSTVGGHNWRSASSTRRRDISGTEVARGGADKLRTTLCSVLHAKAFCKPPTGFTLGLVCSLSDCHVCGAPPGAIWKQSLMAQPTPLTLVAGGFVCSSSASTFEARPVDWFAGAPDD